MDSLSGLIEHLHVTTELCYICEACQHTWSLAWKHIAVGPMGWGKRRFDCLTCLTALDISSALEPRLWSKWKINNNTFLEQHPEIATIISTIDSLVACEHHYRRVAIDINELRCPNCSDVMITDRTTNQRTRCPACRQIAGLYDGTSFSPVRCSDCGHLFFSHRYSDIEVRCEKCETGICTDVDPAELANQNGG